MLLIKIKGIIKKILPRFLIGWYHFGLALIGALVYGFPSKKLKIVGVTGTNGKSTVVGLVVKILEEADFKVASISSIKFKIGEKERPNFLKMTMPGRFKIQKFLKDALKERCDYAVIEVTSEGIKQHRHKFIDFDVAVFTNLTPEHIESHGSFEEYKKAKGKLFKSLEKSQKKEKISIINLDDENASFFLSFGADKRINYGIVNKDECSLQAKDIELLKDRTRFVLKGKEFNLKLKGRFNIYNSLAAISVGLSQRASIENCKKALEKINLVPGRMEEIINNPFMVIVDYAHTPDALEKVYLSVSDYGNKKICVLGSCGGGRDKWKRAQLGEIAAKFCDQIILTNEDPYDENPEKIINQIEEGISRENKEAIKILDRRDAIGEALKIAKKEDVVIITGKGSEPWMCMKNGKKVSWDDRKVVREEFKKLK
jgi:UDP-N-acetylmuramoyl-L-alanyl-D-glutamate--2,6-diaminopimelate ligase